MNECLLLNVIGMLGIPLLFIVDLAKTLDCGLNIFEVDRHHTYD